MIWRLHARNLAFVVALLGGCEPRAGSAPQAGSGSQTAVTTEAGDEVEIRLAGRPKKLEPVEITVVAPENVAAAQAHIDMPAMPMHVAPTTLEPQGNGRFKGILVFTMSGEWVLQLRLSDPKGTTVVERRYDID